MSKKITELLKEATDNLLSDESLAAIEEAFDAKTEEKIQLHVEKALTEQDEEYSDKLNKLLEAIDKDHTVKLNQIVEAITADHTSKLQMVIEKYSTALNEEATSFKKTTEDSISDYLDLYIENAIPQETIEEAVKNKKAMNLVEELRSLLGVNAALVNESIKEALIDGKKQIVEASKELEVAKKQIAVLSESVTSKESQLLILEKTADLDDNKKEYMKKMLDGKSAKFITENFDYTLKMFDKKEEERLQSITEEAKDKTTKVDRVVVEEKAAKPAEKPKASSPYLDELSKY